VRQQEHKEWKDADKATRKRREERRKAHNLVRVQREKEGLSLSTTPENMDNDSDGGVIWSKLEEGSDDEVPLAEEKMLFRPTLQLPPQQARLRLARALRWWVCPARGARRRRRPRKIASVRCRPDGKQHRSGLCFSQFCSVEFLMFPFHFLSGALVIPSRPSWRQPRH
jgi:hypothetical protein